MKLTEKLDQDLKEAMKSQNAELTSILRLLKSAIKNTEIAAGKELSGSEGLAVLEKQAKQRRDSISQYESGNRPDLVEKETSELRLIEKYLPTKLDNEALGLLVEEAINELQASGMSDMGKVMKLVMEKAKGAADGGTVSAIVKERLS